MFRAVLIFCIFLFSVGAGFHVSAAGSCIQKKERITHVLQEASSRLRHRMEEVDQETILAEDTRSDFHWEVEWLLAWLRDQGIRLAEQEGCESLEDTIEAIRGQWVPVQQKSRALRARVTLWHLESVDQISESLRQAKDLLSDIQEDTPLAKSRLALRRAIYLTYQGFRSARKSAILE